MGRAKAAPKPTRRRTAKRDAVGSRLRELDTRARREDSHSAACLLRASKVPCGDDAGRARKNSLLIEAKQARAQASQARTLAAQLASGHVPAPAKARRTKATNPKPAAGGKRKSK